MSFGNLNVTGITSGNYNGYQKSHNFFVPKTDGIKGAKFGANLKDVYSVPSNGTGQLSPEVAGLESPRGKVFPRLYA